MRLRNKLKLGERGEQAERKSSSTAAGTPQQSRQLAGYSASRRANEAVEVAEDRNRYVAEKDGTATASVR
ncbi:hypothetical protein PR048_023985 [Dryococelus australis]|uniref:Uncharacterized protein n=1 Tax=Dryococelus australis TaxID=614101 RepID=A0ABQ9GVJ9_9NEOP|nr:hypothetical protein PR048_023985 [Dryococelus australis]